MTVAKLDFRGQKNTEYITEENHEPNSRSEVRSREGGSEGGRINTHTCIYIYAGCLAVKKNTGHL